MRMRTNLDMPKYLVAYVGGHVHAIDGLRGSTLWSTKLPGAYKASVGSVMLDGDVVLAGVGGRVYCLDIDDGRILWVNELPGMGLGMVSMATPGGHTNDTAQIAQVQMQQAANTASASV